MSMKPTMPTERRPAPARVERLRRVFRNAAVGLSPVLFVGFFLTTVEPEKMSAPERLLALLQRLLMVGLGTGVVVLAGLFGMQLLRIGKGLWSLLGGTPDPLSATPDRSSGGLFGRFLLGVGLGLGVLSLATLALGSSGLVGTAFSAVLLALFFLVGVFELRTIGNSLRRRDPREIAPLSFFELLLVVVFLFVLVLQLILAFGLPLDYDASEYHVAAPARWFQLGRVDFISGNVYTNLPMNCEMLYLFSMNLCGDVMLGIHLAVVMNALTSVLAAFAVYLAARRFVSRRSALAATTLFFTMPLVTWTSTLNVYNEVLLTFYVTLAVYGFLEFSETRRPGWGVLSAAFAGLAAGVKYTALVFFPVCVAPAVVLAACGLRFFRRVGAGVLYVLIVALLVSPWLVKNLALAGNPTYPFLCRVFGGRDWSAELDEKWIAGQFQAAGAAKAGNIFRAMWERVIADRLGSLALAALVLLGFAALRERPVRWLFVFLLLWTLLWYFGTHRVGRFWLPMAGVAAVLAARGFERLGPSPSQGEGKGEGRNSGTSNRPAPHPFDRLRAGSGALPPPGGEGIPEHWRKWVSRALSAALVGALAWQVVLDSVLFIQNAAGSYDLKTGNNWFLGMRGRYDLYPLVLFDRQASKLTPAEPYHLMLVGEARSLYLSPNTTYSTVFNREVFTSTVGDVRDAGAVREGLRRAHVTHVFVNWFEVGRLRETYTWTDKRGVAHPGFPPLSPRDFNRLVEAGVLSKVGEFARTLPKVRGLSPEEIADLPSGRLCVLYAVH